jgi:hypothetical protein
MKREMLMTAALILAGCAATPPGSGVDSYVGQNVSNLTSRLGDAETRVPSGGDTVYGWTKIETVDGIVNGDEFQATQSAQGSSRFNVNKCNLSATADGSGVIKSIHTDGSCTRTIDLLKR